MRSVALLHLAGTTARLCGPGGVRAVIAENLVLKQQLIVLRRGRAAAADTPRDLPEPRPDRRRRAPCQLRMRTMLVVVLLELFCWRSASVRNTRRSRYLR